MASSKKAVVRDARSKAMYQPWNHEEFCADLRVRRMTPSQRRGYVMLLHESFFCSTRPYLPDDDEHLALMADCESDDEWAKNKAAIRKMFEPVIVNGIPLLRQRRVEDDWGRLLEERGVKSTVGKMAAGNRWPNRSAEASAKRSERLAAARKIATHTPAEWDSLLEFCGGICVRCKEETESLCKDHIKPIYQGGSDGIDNLQPLCRTCNSSKGPEEEDHRPDGWRECLQNACETPPQDPENASTPAKRREEREVREEKQEEGREVDAPAPDFENEEVGQEEVISEGDPMSVRKKMSAICRRELGIRPEAWDSTWDEVGEGVEAYGGTEVTYNFEQWCKGKRGDVTEKPITQFLKVMDGMCSGVLSATGAPAVLEEADTVRLVDAILDISDGVVAPNAQQKQQLAATAKEYSFAEVIADFRTYFNEKVVDGDAFVIRGAAANFVQTTADRIRLARRKKEKQALIDSQVAAAEAQRCAERDAEFERIKREEEAEAELTEDTLPAE